MINITYNMADHLVCNTLLNWDTFNILRKPGQERKFHPRLLNLHAGDCACMSYSTPVKTKTFFSHYVFRSN